MTIINLTNVSKSVITGDTSIDIMKGVNLQVSPSEHIAITGPSGSGKTTLLNIISGLDIPSSGDVSVCGIDVSTLGEEDRVRFRDQHISMVFQDFCLFPGLTPFENVKLFMPHHASRVDCESILSEVGLSHRMNVMVRHLSGGEKQRVAIARAMIKKPKLILADEPTAQLDKSTAQQVMDLFFHLKQTQNVTLVLITHDLSVAERCDRVMSLESLCHA
ncbi:MAG: ABC transporter ATP-binding protein [Pseudomonadota bacterium]|nr:ABC transporter ATP-binding protein [Pseudomonadota bacterium]